MNNKKGQSQQPENFCGNHYKIINSVQNNCSFLHLLFTRAAVNLIRLNCQQTLLYIFWLAVFWLLHFPVMLSSGYAIFWLLHFPVIAFSGLSIFRLLHFQVIAFSGFIIISLLHFQVGASSGYCIFRLERHQIRASSVMPLSGLQF
jgi:hypothetical protein